MGQIIIEHPDSSPCFFCKEDMPLTLQICSNCDAEVPRRISVGELLLAFTSGQIIDVRRGGLVWGRHDRVDDICMYTPAVPGVLQFSGLMHGGEFIVNREAALAHRERLEEINAYQAVDYPRIKHLELTDYMRVFNTNGTDGEEGHLAVLFQINQFIVNGAASACYLKELVEINDSMPAVLVDKN